MTTIPAHNLPRCLGQWVTVTNPDVPASWYGRLTALSDGPSLHLTAPGGQTISLPQAFHVTPAAPPRPGKLAPAREAAYEAVYGLLALFGPELPPDPVHRNAMIWRAVNTALDAAGVHVNADPHDPGMTVTRALPNDPPDVSAAELGHALEESHDGWALDLSPECAQALAEQLLKRYHVSPRPAVPGDTGTLPRDTVSPAGDTTGDTGLATGGHVRALLPEDGTGGDLTSGVPARPHPEDTGDTGDTSGDGVRFAYRATVRRNQVHHAIAEAFDLLGAELAHQPEEGGRDA